MKINIRSCDVRINSHLVRKFQTQFAFWYKIENSTCIRCGNKNITALSLLYIIRSAVTYFWVASFFRFRISNGARLCNLCVGKNGRNYIWKVVNFVYESRFARVRAIFDAGFCFGFGFAAFLGNKRNKSIK